MGWGWIVIGLMWGAMGCEFVDGCMKQIVWEECQRYAYHAWCGESANHGNNDYSSDCIVLVLFSLIFSPLFCVINFHTFVWCWWTFICSCGGCHCKLSSEKSWRLENYSCIRNKKEINKGISTYGTDKCKM